MNRILYQANVSRIIETSREGSSYESSVRTLTKEKLVSMTLEDHGSGLKVWRLRFLGDPVTQEWVDAQLHKKGLIQGARKAAGFVAAGGVLAAGVAKQIVFPGPSNAGAARGIGRAMKATYSSISGDDEVEWLKKQCKTYKNAANAGQREMYYVHSIDDINDCFYDRPLYFISNRVSPKCTVTVKRDRCLTIFFGKDTALETESLTLEFETKEEALQMSRVLCQHCPKKE